MKLNKRGLSVVLSIMLIAVFFVGCNNSENSQQSGDSFLVKYSASNGGSIAGFTNQSVKSGEDAKEVTALADSGYVFSGWSDGKTDRTRLDLNITKSIDVTANFVEAVFDLKYTAGGGGKIEVGGEKKSDHLIQFDAFDFVNDTKVTAVADDNYHFVEWSDGYKDITRIDTRVSGDETLVALFEIDSHVVSYTASYGGNVDGENKIVKELDFGDTVTVTAVADEFSTFEKWSDGLTTPTRTDTVSTAAEYIAYFKANTVTLSQEGDLAKILESYTHESITLATSDDYVVTDSELALLAPLKEVDLSDADIIYYEVKIEKVKGDDGKVIKDENGKDVTKEVITPYENTLPKNAFGAANDVKIEKLTLPKSLTTVKTQALSYKTLKYVYMYDKVTVVETSAFAGMSALSYLKLTANSAYTTIEAKTFQSCSALKSITYDIKATSGLIIGNNITKIAPAAFASTGVTNVEIGEKLTDLSVGVLNGTTPQFAFYNFKTINYSVADNHTLYKSIDGNLYDKSVTKLLAAATDEELSLPKNVTEIGVAACYGSAITAVSGQDVTVVSGFAFKNATALASFDFPLLNEIGLHAFYSAAIEGKYYLKNVVSVGTQAFYKAKLSGISLPNATTVADSAFYASALITASIPKLAVINKSVFSGCASLVGVSLPSATSVLDSAFEGCKSLYGIDLPNITVLGKNAFKGATSLYDFNMDKNGHNILPSGITVLNEGVFNGTSITNMVIKGELDSKSNKTGISMFENCTNLEFVVLPSNLDSISKNTFKGCSQLSKITFGDLVNETHTLSAIDSTAFTGCDLLKSGPVVTE